MRHLLAASAILALACQLSEPPEEVAERFWEAVRTGDVAAAQDLATAETAPTVDALVADQTIAEVFLGEVLRNESAAVVETSVVIEEANAHRLRATFDTHLVTERGEWRVDVRETQRELWSSIFATSMRELGQALGEGMHDLKEDLEAGAGELVEAIIEALEDLEAERQRAPGP